jgi:hypothetical protein
MEPVSLLALMYTSLQRRGHGWVTTGAQERPLQSHRDNEHRDNEPTHSKFDSRLNDSGKVPWSPPFPLKSSLLRWRAHNNG